MKNPFSPACQLRLTSIRPALSLLTVGISLPAATGAAQSPTVPNTAGTEAGAQVKACQVGYLPGETKFAFVTSAPAGAPNSAGAAIIRRVGDDAAVLSVPVGPQTYDADTGDIVRPIDFSALRESGTYRLEVAGVGQSFPFAVGNDVFARPFRLAMRAFTGQRCGTAVTLAPDFPEFHYDACHTDLSQFDPSSGKSGAIEATGGWHDAGDYGRYIVNSGITTGTLLWAFELNEAKLKGLNLDVPESGDAMPDMLDEIRWNINWMLKMQDSDGGVWHKETSASFPGFVMPAADKSTALIIGNSKAPFKTTAATADFAAVCAIAARVYKPYDPAYAAKCLSASRLAWAWLESNPDNNYTDNPPGISTGGYGDNDARDERLWAAAELFRTTGEQPFNAQFLKSYRAWSPTLSGDKPQSWGDVHNLAMFTYALAAQPGADTQAVNRIKTDAIQAANGIVRRVQSSNYRTPLGSKDYYWGSNSVAANAAMMLQLTDRLAPDAAYRDCARDTLHYLLGRNTFSTSFVTQVGSKWPMNPHHRPSGADGIEQPWPGLLVGGPNANGRSQPARQWFDVQNDYTTNEIAINWNAPLVFLLADDLPAANVAS